MINENLMTPDEDLKNELYSAYSDGFKSLHGIRPRWIDYDAVTIEWLEEALKDLSEEAKAMAESEAYWDGIDEEDARAINAFVTREMLTKAEALAIQKGYEA